MTNGWEADKRMEDSESLNPLTPHLRSVQVSAKYPLTTCGGFWISAGVSVGEERMKDEL